VKNKNRLSLPRLLAAVCFLVLTGCHSYPPPTPLNQLTAQESRGHEVFEQHCSLCHYDRRDGALHGPSLESMFKKQYLHSGAPATNARVTDTILRGHNLMPAQPSIESDDINDLLAYLHTL
jgi:mono/diheme cytochrome c family protein